VKCYGVYDKPDGGVLGIRTRPLRARLSRNDLIRFRGGIRRRGMQNLASRRGGERAISASGGAVSPDAAASRYHFIRLSYTYAYRDRNARII